MERILAEHDGLAVLDVFCDCPETGWLHHQLGAGYGLVFLRRGSFLRRVDQREMLLDPGVAYFERPDTPWQAAVAYPGGDPICTAIRLPEEVVAELVEGVGRIPDGPVFTDGGVDLAQRVLVARLRAGACDGFEATDQALRLTAHVLAQLRPERAGGGRPGTALVRRRLVDRARELLAGDPSSVGLSRMAGALGVSPYHLSRVFHAETGQTLSRYRNRLRVRLAMERIEAGERNLAGLAFDLGFADHAHLTRTVQREIGCPPARLYPLLGQPA